jgi:Cof subfamily protein (haloacid dehalogenase superfamily)
LDVLEAGICPCTFPYPGIGRPPGNLEGYFFIFPLSKPQRPHIHKENPLQSPLPPSFKSLSFKALALDMDGTLLDPEARISPATAEALRALHHRGLRMLLATGRMTARALPYIQELGLPMDLIAYNGAEVKEFRNGAWPTVRARTLSARTRDAVFALSRERGLFLNVYVGGDLHAYHPSGDFRHCRLYESQTAAAYASKVDDHALLPQEGILKFLVVETPEERDRLYDEQRGPMSSHCDLLKSNPEYLEFVDRGITKGEALEFWLARNGMVPADLIAFGDAENDLEMLRLAGHGVAMANATPGLKAAFHRHSPWSHAEDGVARELSRLFGL